MQKLKQYVDLIKQFKVKKQEVHALLGDEQTKLHRFFEGLATRRWKDDEDAIVRELYGAEFDTRHAPYRALKTELKKKLINLLFLMDFKQTDALNEIQQVYYSALRTAAAIKILIGRGKRQAAMDLCINLLDIALKYDLTEFVLLSAKYLRTEYRTKSPNTKKYEYYRNLYNQYFEIYRVENKAEEYYGDIAGNYINNRSTKKWLKEHIQTHLTELQPYKETVETFQFLWFFGMLELLVHMVINDYRSTLLLCDEYTVKLERKPYLHKSSLIMFYSQKIVCHLMLRQADEGFTALQKIAPLVDYGTHNWFKNRVLFMQLCLHTSYYKEGIVAFIEVIKNENFVNQTATIQEEIKIYEGYFQLLVAIGKINITEEEKNTIGQFRFQRLVNEVPTFFMDKRGLNIPILMIQVVWLLFEKNYDGYIERLDTLSQYKTRHLKNNSNARTNLFIKLLWTLPEFNYNIEKIKKITQKTYLSLVNTTYDINDEAHELEVIPYDVYWLIALETLVIKKQ